MSTVQAFLLGMMVALTPSLVVLASLLLCRTPEFDDAEAYAPNSAPHPGRPITNSLRRPRLLPSAEEVPRTVRAWMSLQRRRQVTPQ
jgi:hypothetical protein